MGGSKVTSYASLHARVRILYSLLLSPQLFADLREAADFASLLSLLKDTAYGPYLAKVEEKDLDPQRATYQIKSRVAEYYSSIIHAAPPETRPLLIQLYRHFELDNLKAILRGNVAGATWDEVRYVLFPLGSFTILPAQNMVEGGNVAAAIELIANSPYYDTLTHAMQRYASEQALFPLEVALDLNYWRTLWEYVHKLPNQDQAQSMRIIGPLVDMNNLMWAIRYRTYHDLSEEEIINYTLPFGYHIRDKDIRAIAAGTDIGGVVSQIYPDLGNIHDLLQQPQRGLSIVEVLLERHIEGQCKAVFSGYPFNIGLELAFLILAEFEIRDLTVLIEAKSTKLVSEEFGPYLVGGQGPSELVAKIAG